jgi:hypothetical protein
MTDEIQKTKIIDSIFNKYGNDNLFEIDNFVKQKVINDRSFDLNYVFHKLCINGIIYLAEILYEKYPEINLNYMNGKTFIKTCLLNRYDMARWLYEKEKYPITILENIFIMICELNEENNVAFMNWFYNIEGFNKELVHKYKNNRDEDLLTIATSSGNLEAVNLLLLLTVDRHYNEDMAFKTACMTGQLNIVKTLYSIDKTFIKTINTELYNSSKKNVRDWMDIVLKHYKLNLTE